MNDIKTDIVSQLKSMENLPTTDRMEIAYKAARYIESLREEIRVENEKQFLSYIRRSH